MLDKFYARQILCPTNFMFDKFYVRQLLCPTGSEDETRIAAGSDVKAELYSALKEILDIAHKLEAEEFEKNALKQKINV